MANALEIDHVTKRFGQFYAVKQLSLSIPRQAIYGLLGPNGAGKTTTIRMVMNIIVPDEGRVEILGGAFYEPILSMLPRRDRIGKIRSYTRWLEARLGARVRGMWIPERVWEPSFVSDVAAAGIEYTILDDFHFKNAGLRDDQLHGYYVTEDEGSLLKVFPGSEPLRYRIPFRPVEEVIDYLREHATESGENVGMICAQLATRHGAARVIFGGGCLRANAFLADTLCSICALAGVTAEVLPDGEYTGALGALQQVSRVA